VRSDIDVLAELATRLGQGERFLFPSTEDAFEELRRASAGGRADYSGITYERLDTGQGLFWPCPDEQHPGTPRMFAERFAHPDGRARIVPVEYSPAAEEPDSEYPLYLTTGRYREHYNSGNQTRRLDRLARAQPVPRVQLHAVVADRLSVTGGSSVVVESRRGSAVFEVEITTAIREDTVFVPFHWGGKESVNLLTSAALDPVSAMPEFKVCAVRLRPL
jgi:assimilatory nitrate reductase catalytic subunit